MTRPGAFALLWRRWPSCVRPPVLSTGRLSHVVRTVCRPSTASDTDTMTRARVNVNLELSRSGNGVRNGFRRPDGRGSGQFAESALDTLCAARNRADSAGFARAVWRANSGGGGIRPWSGWGDASKPHTWPGLFLCPRRRLETAHAKSGASHALTQIQDWRRCEPQALNQSECARRNLQVIKRLPENAGEFEYYIKNLRCCNSRFHSRRREPLLPPPSAVMSSRLASG
jgi:hypothetical protein